MYRILATATLMFIFATANAESVTTLNETMQFNPADELLNNNAVNQNQNQNAHELFVGEWKASLAANLLVTWDTVNGKSYTFDELKSPISPRGYVRFSNGLIWFITFDNDGRTMALENRSSGWGRIFTRVN